MKSGSTLVEIMVSIVILAVIAIAGAAYLTQADMGISIQKNRLSALAVANGCLEEIHSYMYDTILLPQNASTNTYYYTYKTNSLGGWKAPSTTAVTGSVTNHGVPVTVTVRLRKIGSTLDCVEATVFVAGYWPSLSSEKIVLQTLVAVQ